MAKAKRNIEPEQKPPVKRRAYNRKVKELEQPIETVSPTSENPPYPAPMKPFYKRYLIHLITAGVFIIAMIWIYVNYNSTDKIIQRQDKKEAKASSELRKIDSLQQELEKEKFRDSVQYVIDSALESKAKADRISYENYSTKERSNNKKKEDEVKKILRNPDVSWRSLDSLLDSFVPR